MTTGELREAIATPAAVTTTADFAAEVFCRDDLPLADLLLRADPGAARRLHGGSLRRGDPNACVTSRPVLERLLAAGFDPNRPDWLGKTALHHYAGRGDTDNARLMIEHGADLDALDDEYRGTPLAWAARKGHETMVRFLLGRGADPALPGDLPPATPLVRARFSGHEEVVAILESASG